MMINGPLGKIKSIRYRTDHLPVVGNFLMSTKRPRFAYEIVEMRWKAIEGAHSFLCYLKVARWLPVDVPKGKVFHTIVWDSRGKKR